MEWFAAIGQVAGAVATFAAVAVALWIAIADSRRRRREDELRASVSARQVVIGGTGTRPASNGDNGFDHELLVYFTNHGDRPIFDVFAEAWPSGSPVAERAPWAVMQDVVLPGEPPESFMIKVAAPGDQVALAAWRVRWTDAEGRQWCADQPRQRQPLPYRGQPPRLYTGQSASE